MYIVSALLYCREIHLRSTGSNKERRTRYNFVTHLSYTPLKDTPFCFRAFLRFSLYRYLRDTEVFVITKEAG